MKGQEFDLDQEMYDDLLFHARLYTTNERDAEDLVQETCCNAFRQLSTYDPQRASFHTWLRVRMRSEASYRFRRSKANLAKIRRIMAQPKEQFTFADSSADVDALDQFKHCLRILTPGEQALMSEIYVHDQTGVEAARRLGITASAARKRAQRAMRKLRQCTLDQKDASRLRQTQEVPND